MSVKHVFHRPRAAGKTTALADLARLNDGLIICQNADRAAHLRRTHNLREDQVMSYHQLQNRGTRGMRSRPIYVDDAEFILRELLRVDRIDGLSMSNDISPEVMSLRPEQF